jgi:hypothetical protein
VFGVYFPPSGESKTKPILLESSDNESDDENSEILNLDDRNIYLLPSPIKNKKYTRSSIRQKCVSKITEVRSRTATHRQLFPSSENVSSNNENVSLTFDFHSLPSTSSDINNDYQCNIESTSIRPVNIETEIETQPVWSKKNDILIDLLPFTSPEGPTAVIHDLSMCTPTTIFKCLFTDEIVNQIVHHTNLYAYQKQLKTGKAFMRTNMSEMQCFIGMQLLMGIKKQCSYRDYWSTSPDLHDSYISCLMPVNRFGWLLSHLHLNDNSLIPKKNQPGYDKLYKIRPFIQTLLNNFQRAYNPSKIIAIDESMVKFTGRNSNKQYMPKKPIKRGFKIWCLVDKQGYLWNFEIYTGKVGEKAEKQLGARVVKQLSQPLQEKNHCLFFDNYFTSYPLMTYLKSKNINACGTVNLTRKFLPALKNDKHLTLGEYDWSIDEESTSIVKWRDKRIVSLLSNFHNPTETTQVQRRCKDGSTTMVSCPIVLSEYNKHMNCVDKFDQNKKSCQIDRKAKKWWHRLFFHFIDAAVVNSYVLYKLQSGNNIIIFIYLFNNYLL